MTDVRGNLLVLSAPSGTGKSSLVRLLLQRVPDLHFSVSATTRPPRPGERDGVDYRFTDVGSFRQAIQAGDFLEHAEVHGNLYGTPRAATEATLALGRDVLLEIDVQGARQVRDSGVGARLIFVLPPSRHDLEARLRGRGLDSEEVIRRRLQDATTEVRSVGLFETILVNDDLEATADRLAGVVLALRSSRQAAWPRVERVLETFGIAPGSLAP